MQVVAQIVQFVQQQEQHMEKLRQELNHEIMFNLKDTFLAVGKHQSVIGIQVLAQFMTVGEEHAQALQKLVKWNNHNSSLNLSFAEFSAMIVSRQDRLLAKVILQRQEMGAIPNFLLDLVRQILRKELEIHQYCLDNSIPSEQLAEWIESVIDENGDIDDSKLVNTMNAMEERGAFIDEEEERSLFLKYMEASGNITAQRLRFLFTQAGNEHSLTLEDNKMQKLSTMISSPKSLLSPKSSKTMLYRSEYYDCINRPVSPDPPQVRETKSIQRHISRIDSAHRLKLMGKSEIKQSQTEKQAIKLLIQIRQLMSLERQMEQLRIQLCLCTDFYPVLFYDSITKDRSKQVSPTNFKDYLESFGYKVTMADIYALFRRYGEKGKLTFNTFCTIFDVCESEYALLEKNRYIQSLQDVAAATKKLYFCLLLLVCRTETKINTLKMNLFKEVKDVAAAVRHLFADYDNEVSQQDFRNIYTNILNWELNRYESKLLWKRFGLSSRRQDTLSRQLLLQSLLPYYSTLKNKH